MSEMSPFFKFFSTLFISLVSVSSLAYGLEGIETIDVGGKPVSSVFAYSKLYINNEQDNNVTVLDTNTHKILKKIEVGKKPISSFFVGKNIYVNNLGDNFISVIDALTNLVTKTILVEAFPNSSRHASAKLYVTNSGSDTVSIINTTTESWLKNVKLGQSVTQPSAVFVTWGRVLVLNLGSSDVTILDEKTGSFKKLIPVSGGPIDGTVVGKKVYLYSPTHNTVSIIDASRDAFADNITLETGSVSGTLVGTKLYINHPTNNTVSVIDTASDSLLRTIPVGLSPVSSTLMGTYLYVNNSKGNSVSVIDTATNTVIKTIPVEAGPVFSARVGNRLYVHSADAGKISVIYESAPLLNALSSTTANGTYGVGAKIDISMIFDQPLLTGSTATVTLNNGAILTLSKVDGRSLFWEYVVAAGQDKADLSVTSLKDVKIIGISGLQNTAYTIPTWKNLGDYKNIVIDSKIVTTTPTPQTPVELVCRDTGMYRLCPLTKTPENTMEYRENMICEWFVSEDQSRSKRISRIEVLNIAVNMLHGVKTPAEQYTNAYTDITVGWNSQETVSIIQTGLDNGLIFTNDGAFEPTKKISRIEAYALLMRGVCMSPVEGEEDMARAIHQKAMQEGITTKQWAKFRPYSGITRNEVFIVASALADWADKHGGCDKLECRK